MQKDAAYIKDKDMDGNWDPLELNPFHRDTMTVPWKEKQMTFYEITVISPIARQVLPQLLVVPTQCTLRATSFVRSR